MKALNLIPVIIVLFFIQNVSTAQNIEKLFQKEKPVRFEKLYLHTDRDFYFLGETIWFKAYLLDGQSFALDTNIQNLYIELIDDTEMISQNQVLVCDWGEASGSLIIPDTISSGSYVIRAYTDYLKNFGEEAFFHKALVISEIKSSLDLEFEKPPLQETNREIDISFFPEGGYLISGTQNLVAFKAVDKYGKGVSISGKVLDNEGEILSLFKTQYKGMGKIHMYPIEGKSYHIAIDKHPDFEYNFSDIRNDEVKLQLLNQTNEILTLGVVSNSSLFAGQLFFLACFSRDQLLFYKAIMLEDSIMPIKVEVETDLMKRGINRFILLNGELEPVSERLVFWGSNNVNNLEIKPSKQEYETRTSVQLEIFDENEIIASGYSSLSVAVVDENALSSKRGSQNILSYLLLDSEIKGFNQSPADYFYDDDSITSQAKLNLLMLTHGWSRYLRNSFRENSIEIKYPKTAGLLIKGRAERSNNKPIADEFITMGIFEENNIHWLEGKTDSMGHFHFNNTFFYDTATIFIQAQNKRGKQKSEVFLDNLSEEGPAISPAAVNLMKGISDIPLQHYRQKYYSYIDESEFIAKHGTIFIEEVEIKGKKIKKDDGHFRLYQRADQVLEVTVHDIAYHNVLQYLQGRVAGLSFQGMSLRGSTSLDRDPTPLFLLDGMPLQGEGEVQDAGEDNEANDVKYNDPKIDLLNSIPMSQIDKVEILKGNSAAIYGSQAANGVIAIYTRKGSAPVEIEDYTKKTITKNVIGFSRYREFYSPQYTPENFNSPKPDHRTTLYWEPIISVEDGTAALSFFTSDDFTNYRVIVEGVMENGAICFGSARFTVDKRNENLED